MDDRVVIDNESCKTATVIQVFFFSGVFLDYWLFLDFQNVLLVLLQVDSANKHGILLEVIQVLTDLNLMITKAYICSDGGWFMDGTNTAFFSFMFRHFVLLVQRRIIIMLLFF